MLEEDKEKIIRSLEKYFENHNIFDLSNILLETHQKNKKQLKKLIKSDISPIEKLLKLKEITKLSTIFLNNFLPAIEIYYDKIIKKEVPKYIKENIDDFISQASIPKKKNAYNLMLEALKNFQIEKVQKEFSWLKSRDGFTDFYTIEEL
ncbi:MAG: hypothetical protein LBU14_05270 [Candidatus Peribacteria bacterium]|nr:hypothetical protein [Candidatus Peribacteria bacterium]